MRRWLAWVPAASVAVTISYVSHQPDLPEVPGGPPDWLLHMVAFGGLCAAVAFGASEGWRPALRLPRRTPWFVVATTLYGVVDELHQSMIAGRDASALDVLADGLGAVLVALAIAWCWSR